MLTACSKTWAKGQSQAVLARAEARGEAIPGAPASSSRG